MPFLPRILSRWLTLLLSVAMTISMAVLPARGTLAVTRQGAAESAAAWLANQVSAQGWVASSNMRTAGSLTVYAGLALAAADVHRPAFDRVVGWMEAHHGEFTPDGNGVERPGAVGQVALLAAAAGKNARNFGGSDLVAKIQANETPAGADAGMYGLVNTAAAVFLHSFAMLGLRAAGSQPSAQAVAWLRAQQCPDGSWPAYRSTTHRAQGTCAASGTGSAEADATAMAIQALALEGPVPANAADGLRLLQRPGGGFAFAVGSTPNANSSGLAVQAIAALSQDATSSAWTNSGGSALAGLRSFQVTCTDTTESKRGGIRYLSSSNSPDVLSTSQAIWGLSGRPFTSIGSPRAVEPIACPTAATSPPPDPPTSPTEAESEPDPNSTASPGNGPSFGSGGGSSGSGGSAQRGTSGTGTPVPSPTPQGAPIFGRAIERLSGQDRHGSAVEVSRELFVTGVPVVYLTSSTGFADALAAGPAAAHQRGPVLLTPRDALPAVVVNELQRLNPQRIVVLGGPAAISEHVVRQAMAHASTTRIAGRDRYATAAALSAATFRPGVKRVVVTTGETFPDSLAGIAATLDGPILLVGRDQVPSATTAELRRLGPEEVLVLGGPAAISEATFATLQSTVEAARRVFGEHRYETAALALQEGVDRARVVYVASGESFPDALAAAAAAGVRSTGILLVTRDSAPSVVLDEIRRLDPGRIIILGGITRISEATAQKLAGA